MFADNSIAEKESVESLSLERKASQDSSGSGIRLIPSDHVSNPGRLDRGDSGDAAGVIGTPRQGVSRSVLYSLAIDDGILQSQHLSQCLVLPLCVQVLIIQMNQSSLIRDYLKFASLQVRAPLINS
jgi:hypothetical protein